MQVLAEWHAGGWRARGRSAAIMYGAGALLVGLSMLSPVSAAAHRPGLLAVAGLAALAALAIVALGPRYTIPLSHTSTVAGSLLVSLIVGLASGTLLAVVFGMFLVWVALFAAVFYSPRAALRHTWLAAIAHALALWAAGPPHWVIAWLVTAGTCHVVLICYRLIERFSARLRALVEHSGGVVALINHDWTVKYVGGPIEHLLAYDPTDLARRSLLRLVHPEDVGHALRSLSQVAEQASVAATFEARMLRGDGGWLNTEVNVSNATENTPLDGFVLTLRDISERKRLEADLTYQAFHDPLTKLPNRALFTDRVEHALARRQPEPSAVLFIDVDNFKHMNDSLGHAVGDLLLKAVGERLHGMVRAGDTASRLGGDEFAVLLEGVWEGREATALGERLLDALRAPFALEGREVFVSASIGIAIASPGAATAHELLRDAGLAMYFAKSRGKGRYEVFHPVMHEHVLERVELEADLRGAIDREEFSLRFQAVVDIQTGRAVGAEALVRWEHPVRGTISPAAFIPVAEETGLIVPLGRWVLRQACREGRDLQLRLPAGDELHISVNLSGRQLEDPALVAEVADALAVSQLPADKLVLEITESVLAHNLAETRRILEELRALGVRVAVDDFGTGYSSLGYLKTLPVDILKIDRTFVSGIGRGPDDSALTDAIVKLGHSMGLSTVAEGIEDAAELEYLRQARCDLGQGFLFGRPVPAEELILALQGSVADGASEALAPAGGAPDGKEHTTA